MKSSNNSSSKDIEVRLTQNDQPVLSVSEKLDMKSSLMTYADFYTPVSTSPVLPWYRTSTLFTPVVSMVVLLVVIVGTGTSVANSLPGESLYAVKLQVVEPLEFALFSPADSIARTQTVLMERRLEEVHQLLDETGVLSVAATDDVTAALAEYTDTLTSSIANEATSTVSTLAVLDTASALIDAHDVLLNQDASFDDSEEMFNSLADTLKDTQIEYVSELITDTGTSTLSIYLDQALDDIASELSQTEHTTGTVASTSDYLDEATGALSRQQYEDAHEAIAEANQLLLTEGYIEDDESEEESPTGE